MEVAWIGVVLVLAAGLTVWRFWLERPLPPLQPYGRSGLALRVTGADPYEREFDEQTFRLRVYGNVQQEQALSLDDVRAMTSVETGDPLMCVLDWANQARWRGVPIRDVLRKAGLQTDGTFVVFRDDRDFSSSLSMAYIETGAPILAYEVNGEPLPREHGWPLRVVAPGKWGYKWVKWVTELEVTDRGYEGSYESRGFSLDGDVNKPQREADVRGVRSAAEK